MMSKEFLKKVGIVGVSFGLIASPLAFADMHDEGYEPQDPAPQEATDVETTTDSGMGSADGDATHGGVGTDDPTMGTESAPEMDDIDSAGDGSSSPEHGGVGSDDPDHGTESLPDFEDDDAT
ncbi:hypothetical protein SAMN05192555_12017 [Franzmannia pantelleriensis]|uniref:Uncharacterized protein n=1 Tax=Franzmannia pantelleriensis TaxID=48727 RepID=A0A1G9W850_9GAMM|nr:hypothetical protein [Halomonas pantelleriensis]SDM80670.1 hypothetical protein SAMN05192555_12017 [Halomonas pantelleriensis]